MVIHLHLYSLTRIMPFTWTVDSGCIESGTERIELGVSGKCSKSISSTGSAEASI